MRNAIIGCLALVLSGCASVGVWKNPALQPCSDKEVQLILADALPCIISAIELCVNGGSCQQANNSCGTDALAFLEGQGSVALCVWSALTPSQQISAAKALSNRKVGK